MHALEHELVVFFNTDFERGSFHLWMLLMKLRISL